MAQLRPMYRVLRQLGMLLAAFAASLFPLLANGCRRAEPNPAAYVLPVSATANVKIGWSSHTLTVPVAVTAGKKITIPEGTTVLLIRGNGSTERLVGPRKEVVGTETNTKTEFLTAPLKIALEVIERDLPGEKTEGIRINSPASVTRFTNPVIVWTSKPNVLYDVAVVDPADEAAPPRKLRGVKPPVRLEQLETTMRPELAADRIFLIVVRESSNPEVFGGDRFLVADDAQRGELPTDPAGLVGEALSALTKTPARAGDAWLALSRLPVEWQQSELGLRLRAETAGKLRDHELFQQVKAESAKPR